MSMQSVLGVVGGVVGSFFGVPQLGFIAGSLIGGLLTPKEKTEGPRLDDLKVQVSTYGAGIPMLYGTDRIGGNVVWSTDKLEFANTTEVGKGGGAERTDYTYFVQMRVALCETPRDGSTVNLVQIFRDGKLKWDARSGIPVEQALASEENLFAFFTLYQGHSDQLPDPVEEIYQGGPGSVPAYRGLVCISMKGIDCPGGRVPQFSFVLSNSATVGVEKAAIAEFTHPFELSAFGIVGLDRTVHVAYREDAGLYTLVQSDIGMGYNKPRPTITLVKGGGPTPLNGSTPSEAFAVQPAGNYSGSTSDLYSNPKWLELIDLQTGLTSVLYSYEGTDAQHVFPGLAGLSASYDPTTGYYAFAACDDVSNGNVYALNPIILKEGIAYSVADETPSGSFVLATAMYGGTLAILITRSSQYHIRTYSVDTLELIEEIPGPSTSGVIQTVSSALRYDATGLYAWVYNSSPTGISSLYSIENSGWILLCDEANTINEGKDVTNQTTFYASKTSMVIGPSGSPFEEGDREYDLIRFNAVTLNEVTVKDIIADQCERAGETRYDVSGIPDTDTIHGYKIQNPASARANIDPLFTAFAIFAVEEDGLIKFKKYEDITSVATITYDELGQVEDGSDPGDPFPLSRTQEIDLPRSVAVSYVEQEFDYQTATEKAVRQVTGANEDLLIELPIATNSDRARTVADMIMFARWRQQNTRAAKVSRKFAYVTPGDGVTIEYPRGTFGLWRLMNTTDTGVICEWSLEPGDAELYTQTAVGATGYVRQEVSALAPPTEMAVIDGPVMQDSDNDAGLYVAMEGVASGWIGAELLIGDDEATLEPAGTVSSEAIIGFTETALGNFTRNVVDEVNLLTVNVGDGTLSSNTRDVLFSGRSNAAVVGRNGRWEVIKYQRVDDLGDGRYILSGLLRGQRGTEWAAGTHQVNDLFVVLGTAGTLRPNFGAGSIGQTKTYKAVSKGRSASTGTRQEYANTGEGLKPFSPVDMRKSISSNNITLTWCRRSRLSDNILATGVIPLGESVERYEVAIYSDGTYATVKRVLSAFTTSVVYTSADQIIDFGSNQTTLHVRVYQLSDTVGRGHELQATV